MGGSRESGVEPGPHERGDHHLLAPRLRRPADAYHSGDRLVDDRGSDERLDLTSCESVGGSLASGKGTVLRGCELSNGAHGVVASHM